MTGDAKADGIFFSPQAAHNLSVSLLFAGYTVAMNARDERALAAKVKEKVRPRKKGDAEERSDEGDDEAMLQRPVCSLPRLSLSRQFNW